MNNRFADQFSLVCFSIKKDSTLKKRILSLEGFDSFNAYLGLYSCRKLVQDWCIWCINQPQIPENPCNSPLLNLLLVQTFHGGEQQNIADGLAVGQQHGHAVDAEADAARGGQDDLSGHQRPSSRAKTADFAVIMQECCKTSCIYALLNSLRQA